MLVFHTGTTKHPIGRSMNLDAIVHEIQREVTRRIEWVDQ
jgi:hypothetical protein